MAATPVPNNNLEFSGLSLVLVIPFNAERKLNFYVKLSLKLGGTFMDGRCVV